MVDENSYFMAKLNMSAERYFKMLREHPIVIEYLRQCELYENILGDIKDAVISSDIEMDEEVIDVFMNGKECEFKTYEEYDEFMTMMEYLSVNLEGKHFHKNYDIRNSLREKYSRFHKQRKEKYAI